MVAIWGGTEAGVVLPADVEAAFEQLPDDVVIVDERRRLLWLSRSAAERAGSAEVLELVLGRDVLEFLHPDDRELIRHALASLWGEPDRRIPLQFRLLDADDVPLPTEATGSTMVLPTSSGAEQQVFVFAMRENMMRDAMQAILQAAIAGESLTDTLELMISMVTSETLGVRAAVRLGAHGDAPARILRHPSLPELLVGDDGWEGTSPWERARRTGLDVSLDVAELPPAMRRVAEDEGLCGVVALPVPDPGGDVAAVLVGWFAHELIQTVSPLWLRREALPLLQLVLEQYHARDRLELAARYDALTGLANRSQLLGALHEHLRRSASAAPVAVLYVDLDDFKPINDRFGHAAGDTVLVEVGERLRRAVRPGDVVGRLGGDEFVVVCPGSGGIGEAAGIGERLLELLAEPIRVPGTNESVEVGASVGVAIAHAGGTADELLGRADQALYAAKAAGRNRVVVSA